MELCIQVSTIYELLKQTAHRITVESISTVYLQLINNCLSISIDTAFGCQGDSSIFDHRF